MGLDNPLHIAFLVVILLLVFGARRLPEIGRSLGSGMREFKQSITGESTPQQPTLGAGPQQAPAQNGQQAPAQTADQAAPAQAPEAQPAAVGQQAGEQPTEQRRA
jgi:sec-independent protein translocase protein TatA